MKMTLIWVLMHIVGPITLLTIVVGFMSKATKALFPNGHQRAATGIGSAVSGALSGVWHFFFLTAEDRHRLDTHDTTGVDPALTPVQTAQPSEASTPGAPLDDSDIPESLLASFASMYAEVEPGAPNQP